MNAHAQELPTHLDTEHELVSRLLAGLAFLPGAAVTNSHKGTGVFVEGGNRLRLGELLYAMGAEYLPIGGQDEIYELSGHRLIVQDDPSSIGDIDCYHVLIGGKTS